MSCTCKSILDPINTLLYYISKYKRQADIFKRILQKLYKIYKHTYFCIHIYIYTFIFRYSPPSTVSFLAEVNLIFWNSHQIFANLNTRKIEAKSRDPGVKKSAVDSEFHSGNPGKLNKRRTYQSKRHLIVLGVSTFTWLRRTLQKTSVIKWTEASLFLNFIQCETVFDSAWSKHVFKTAQHVHIPDHSWWMFGVCQWSKNKDGLVW